MHRRKRLGGPSLRGSTMHPIDHLNALAHFGDYPRVPSPCARCADTGVAPLPDHFHRCEHESERLWFAMAAWLCSVSSRIGTRTVSVINACSPGTGRKRNTRWVDREIGGEMNVSDEMRRALWECMHRVDLVARGKMSLAEVREWLGPDELRTR